ncbi:uncharacterized protein LOC144701792 [Wolffia australiana]
MAGTAGLSRSALSNRWCSSSCPISLFGRRPTRLSFSSRDIHRSQSWCILRRNRSIWRIRVFSYGEEDDGVERGQRSDLGSFDDGLVFVETLCIVPSVLLAIGGVLNLVFNGRIKIFQSGLGNAMIVSQFVLLVGAVVAGRMIRRRQWQRFCRENGASFNLIDRIEKVEEDLRRSTGIIHALTRQLEKLGIRFRVTRRTLKDPISETAALAQKNSEATRALAMREDILEKELGEIQKVLLAMQEQQRKQLELILAVSKAGKLIDGGKEETSAEAPSPGQSPSRRKIPSQSPQ